MSTPPASRLQGLLPIIVALLAYATVLAKGNAALDDPDPYWHIVLGRWIIDHRAVPQHDIFSHSVAGTPWVPHEWLADVAMAWLYDRLGWTGLVAAAGLAFAAALAILTRALLRYLAPGHAIIGVATAWGLCFPHLLARPHVFALPLLVAWAAALVAARHDDRAPSPLLALLMVPWANLHGGYMLGLALVALFAGEAVFDAADRRAAIRAAGRWGLFGVLSVAAALATPHGIDGLLFPLQLTRLDFALSLVNEWQSPNFQQPQPLEAWLLLALLGALYLGVRLPITRILMLLLLLHMALRHQRHDALLGLLAPLLVAPALAPQLEPYQQRFAMPARFAGATKSSTTGMLAGATKPLATGMLAAALVIAVLATALRIPIVHDRGRFTPAAALAAVAEHRVTGPVLNDFNFGGYLIFSGIAPFIDGRVEVYGDPFIRRYITLEELPRLLTQYRIAWTLLAPGSPRVALMDNLPGWRRLHADGVAVVHVRELPRVIN